MFEYKVELNGTSALEKLYFIVVLWTGA